MIIADPRVCFSSLYRVSPYRVECGKREHGTGEKLRNGKSVREKF